MNEKDSLIIKKIVSYCDQIEETRILFGDSFDGFSKSYVFQNACCMCLLQIGELAGRLSKEALDGSQNIPWR